MQKDNFYKQQGRLVVPLVSGVLWSYTVNWGRPCPAAEVETRTSLLPRHNPFPGEQVSQNSGSKAKCSQLCRRHSNWEYALSEPEKLSS